jgi:hypothetical protein
MRVQTWCAVLVVAEIVTLSGRAVAQDVPRPGPYDSVRLSADDRDGRRVFDMQFALKGLTATGGFLAAGTVRFSPKLCESRYAVLFTYTTNKGLVLPYRYPARMQGGRLDGVRKACPFAGLPRRGLESLRLEATIQGRPLVRFRARPLGRRGDPLAWLRFRELVFPRANTPAGAVHAVIRARYRSHRSHIVRFVADTDIALPPR